jgi:membrane-associated protein
MIPSSGNAVIDWIIGALSSYGYLIVFTITIFENLFVVGSATPGETVVMAAAFVAAQGGLRIELVWIVSVLGTVTGSNISYLFGHARGRGALDALAHRLEGTRVGRLVGIHRGSMAEAEDYFARYGSKTIFVSRFAWGLKNFMPVVAGASRMPLLWFELWTLIGAITYTSLMCAIGWFLGRSFERALSVAGGVGYVGFAIAFAIFATIVVIRIRSTRREAREREAREMAEAELLAETTEDVE